MVELSVYVKDERKLNGDRLRVKKFNTIEEGAKWIKKLDEANKIKDWCVQMLDDNGRNNLPINFYKKYCK